MRVLGLTNFANMALPLARLHSHPLHYWFKENDRTNWSVQGAEARPRGHQSPPLVAHLQATAKINMQTLSRESTHNRCFQGKLWRPHDQPVIQRQATCKEGQRHPHQYLRTGNSVIGLWNVWGSNGGKAISFQIDNTIAVAYLLKEGNSLKGPKWSCEEDLAQMSQEWGKSIPSIHQMC